MVAVQSAADLAQSVLNDTPPAGLESLEGLRSFQAFLEHDVRLEPSVADGLQLKWLKQLVEHPRGELRDDLVTSAIWHRIRRLRRRGETERLIRFLGETTLALVEEIHGAEVVRSLIAWRCDFQRIGGHLQDAMLGVQEARRMGAPNATIENLAVKLALDLGQLDVANQALGNLAELARQEDASADTRDRLTLSKVRFLHAVGEDRATLLVAEAAKAEIGPLRPMLEVHEAIARARLVDSDAGVRQELGRLDALLASGLETAAWEAIVKLERLGLMTRSEDPELWERARNEAAALQETLEDTEAPSTLFDARAAAWLARAERLLGHAEPRSEMLGRAVDSMISIWRELGDVWGGVGFLEFADRRLVVSEAIAHAHAGEVALQPRSINGSRSTSAARSHAD